MINKRIARWVMLALLGVGAAMIGVEVWHARQTPVVAESAPSFAFPDLDGRVWPSDTWQGRVVLINFWASWCAPCVKEVPTLIDAQRQWGDRGLQVLGIALDQGEPVRVFAKRLTINYPVLLAGMDGFDLSQSFGNETLSIPYSVVLDRNGRVRHQHLGIVSPEQLAQWVPPLLAEPVASEASPRAE